MEQTILAIGENAEDQGRLASFLETEGYAVVLAHDHDSAVLELSKTQFQTVVTDWDLGGRTATDVCRAAAHQQPGLPVIVLSGEGTVYRAIHALRAGAYDFSTKPVDWQVLRISVKRALKVQAIRSQLRLIERPGSPLGTHGLIGESKAMQRVYSLIDSVADTPSSVVVTGESGTGKELVARALHASSSRKDQPFVALNCSSVPGPLLESEIFGHEKGAFTDAKRARNGLFVQANGGTLFMDEIGEMPQEMQAKLLRLLQQHVVRPLGSSREVHANVRIVAATHDDLERDVEMGKFREDLYFRLNVIRIHLPPLRERENDVLLLGNAFVKQSARRIGREVEGISPEAAECLLGHRWPGNVRELQNCMERAVTLTRYNKITPADLPESVTRTPPPEASDAAQITQEHQVEPLEDIERRYIAQVLQVTEYNKSRTAQLLKMDRRTLYRKLRRYDLDSPAAALL